jgi:hypothetical protein
MLRKFEKSWKQALLFTACFILLFFNFQFNSFNVVDEQWFESFQKDSESLVVGRLIKSRNDGVLSEQGRLGRYQGLPGSKESVQTKLYNGELDGGRFGAYNSQLGIQGIFFSIFDDVLNSLNIIDIKKRLDFYRGITAGIFALILSLVIMLFYFEIGLGASVMLLLSMSLSQWLTVMARNLYWVMALMYLPFLAVFIIYKYEEVKRIISFQLLYSLVFITILLKSLSGYEFISTIIIAAVSPIIYFSIKNQWDYLITIKRVLLTVIFGVLGFLTALIMHIWQLHLSTGSIGGAWNLIFERILVRTHAASNTYAGTPYEKSLSSSIYEVFRRYINGDAIELKSVFGSEFFITISFESLIWAYLIATILALAGFKFTKKYYRQLLALSVATWFSFAAPLSWFFLAKGHSYIHVHINYILWYLPFIIFGFALFFFVFSLFMKELFVRSRISAMFLSGFFLLLLSSAIAYDVFNLEDDVVAIDSLTAYDHSDANWKNGVSKSRAGFFVRNTKENRISITDRAVLVFPFSGERTITDVKISKDYINIYVSGNKLSPELDGFPNKIKITVGAEK